MTASGLYLAKALAKSDFFWGEPWTASRDGDFNSSSEEGLRTSAVMAWPRERASLMMSLPVRPLPPRTRTRILNYCLGLSLGVG